MIFNFQSGFNYTMISEYGVQQASKLSDWKWTVTSFVLFMMVVQRLASPQPKLDHIPAMGPTNFFLSFIGFIRYFRDSRGIIQKGYEQHRGMPFRVPLLDKWAVVVCGPRYLEDMRRAPNHDLSLNVAVGETVQMDYTMGPDVYQRPYQIEVVRSSLYCKFPERIPDVWDETSVALEDAFAKYTVRIRQPSSQSREWVPFDAVKSMPYVVCRSVNRIFVDLPMCRNDDYIQLNVQYTMDVVMSAMAISVLPRLVKPLIAPLISPLKSSTRRALESLRQPIEDRLRKDVELGRDWPGRPNDLISWLLDHAEEDQRTVEDIAQRVLFINFASIHTTANVLAQAIYRIAKDPVYAIAIREEIATVIRREDGWTHSALARMVKLDSFLRETMRIEGPGQFLMSRIVVNPNGFRFHDGTYLPPGTFLSCGAYSVHHDVQNYTDPDEFDGFRFAKASENKGNAGSDRLTYSSSSFLAFGSGVHSCPGRFFAAAHMKVILGHILMMYDVSYRGSQPRTKWYGENCIADPASQLLLRRRMDMQPKY